ncbi:uncharacterized protein G6M90_00g032970 [Metarhizium brunneum]|uniref:Uncharacterized protein n=1 Tax=Metarhizium brunneum TaxID=500148 RepID=A0A7D5YY77_9HYPO|nr:hypothetical protein G6M90_00g032970 [Metarhizium brunneum]
MKTALVALLAAAVASVFTSPVPEPDPEAPLTTTIVHPQRADTRYENQGKIAKRTIDK